MPLRGFVQGPMTPTSSLDRYTPALVAIVRKGYSPRAFAGDLLAGLTVAIIAMPLAMALGIASIPADVAAQLQQIHPWLTPPAMGLFTAVVAGFLISALGGSHVQIGGPTAAFIPIVFGVASAHGYQGLAAATLMAGVIVVLMGLFRFGALIKFIPYPVVTGFTSGIAVTILASQVKDFLGLSILTPDGSPASVPADFIPKIQVLASNLHTSNWQSAAIGAGSLLVLVVLRKLMPRLPGAIVVVVASALLVWATGWSTTLATLGTGHTRPLVETIGTRFGGIPGSLPAPHAPPFSWATIPDLVPAATTIAILCAIESLLSAVVADGMTGRRHRSDQELVAQGLANVASSFFFGLPATGAIARTAANIKTGARSPIAGMLHAVFLLAFMLAAAPLASLIPLPTLSAILILVAWNIAEIDHFRALLRAPRPDMLVLLTTFGLTVFTDLTLGVGVGMVLASFLFMKRMADLGAINGMRKGLETGREPDAHDPKDPAQLADLDIPHGVEVFEVNGPFFFGVADRLKDVLDQLERPPKVFILRMRYVPHIDATGLHALEEFIAKCRRQGVTLLLGGVHAHPMFEMTRAGMDQQIGVENMFDNLEDALARARMLIGSPEIMPTA
ncbi:MAG: sulfate permease [Phycisphaerales bacterium]